MDFLLEYMCTCVYTHERWMFVVDTKEKILYQFNIKCPCCRKRLMTINLSQYRKPVVSIFSKDDSGIHNTETRCPICKSFVAVDV